MAEKIQKGIPWFLIIVLFCTVSVLVFEKTNEVMADTNIVRTLVSVGNATPTVSSVNITASPIVVTENATTAVYCLASTSDINGYGNISSASALIFREGAASLSNGIYSCGADDNKCYSVASCDLWGGDGNTKNATCTANVWFHAEPTDAAPYAAEKWFCQVKAVDASNASSTATDTSPSELSTQYALIVESPINYGSLSPNTSSTATSTKATTTGNAAIDVNLYGVNLDGAGATFIAVGAQEYSSNTSLVHSGGLGVDLLVSAGANYNLDLATPTAHPSLSADNIYWTILIPEGQDTGDYSGTNTISAIAPL